MELEPNRTDIERHIELLSMPWANDYLSALMEIRCIPRDGASRSFHFDPTDEGFTDEAISSAIDLNESGWNVYVCVNPIECQWRRPASDENIVGAYFAFADADDERASIAIKAAPIKPHFMVRTGSIPFERLHAYWHVSGIFELKKWRQVQQRLIANFNSDAAIKNPSRIMRLAGTISYPSPNKIKRGYKPELTILMEAT